LVWIWSKLIDALKYLAETQLCDSQGGNGVFDNGTTYIRVPAKVDKVLADELDSDDLHSVTWDATPISCDGEIYLIYRLKNGGGMSNGSQPAR
jgi:hypothetical protein